MDKKLLTRISICVVSLLILASMGHVVGFQTVQSSNKQIIKEEVNQRELLFQIIVDIANNQEIQRIILKSQTSREIFIVSGLPVLTKNQLKQIYFFGLFLSKTIGKIRMQLMVQQNQLINPEIRKEITTVIENDATLISEISHLKNSECDCENKNTIPWRYPVLCSILGITFFGLGATFVFFDNIISDGRLGDYPILVVMTVLFWLEIGSLLTTVDCLFHIYCETEVLGL